jgi:hypothetical protein
MSKYPPLFKRVRVEDGKPILDLQIEFEKFWKRISPLVEKNSEKTQGMRKLQEACMWFSRAIALSQFKSDDEDFNQKEYNPIGKGAINEHDANFKPSPTFNELADKKAKERIKKPDITYKNKMRIKMPE